jgi:arginine utilization protein RocB
MLNNDLENQFRELIIDLVSTSSVVDSDGERVMADKIIAMLSAFDVFKQHPDWLRICPVKEDPLNRYSILALIKKPDISETVLGIGHFDTVAVEDYGILKSYAHDPIELAKQLKSFSCDPEVLSDLEDADYLFGRGSLDMKSGIAIWLTLLRQLSQADVSKNLLVCFVCDEEGNSKGMIDTIPHIKQMIVDHQLDINSAIDTDYTSPQFAGDDRRFLYGGTIGKILVQYLCMGKEAHAGDPYVGIDANELVSALIDEINMNPTYCDINELDITVPPITLSVKDDKRGYSVQTAKSASVTFNVTTIGKDLDIWQKMFTVAAEKAVSKVKDKLNNSYKEYCQKKGREFTPLDNDVRVSAFQIDPTFDITPLLNEDERDFSLRWVKEQYAHDPQPKIIMFLSMPYYPSHTLNLAIEKHRTFLSELTRCAQGYTTLPYYPYISDLSFVCRAKGKDIDAISRLIPGYKYLNRIDWSALDGLDVPMMNIGPWGKDAHKYTERVHVPSVLSVFDILRRYLTEKKI